MVLYLFDQRGAQRTCVPVFFLFVAGTRNGDRFYIFLIVTSDCKKGGLLWCLFSFCLDQSMVLRFLQQAVIPKKQINAVCDPIFVACIHCKYTYTAKVICVSDNFRFFICVFFVRYDRICCLGYLKRFMIENRGYENSNCLHHNWGVLFAHMRFLMGKI